jgi:hypothetical protein
MFSKILILFFFLCACVVSLRAEDFVGDVFKEPEEIPMLKALSAGAGSEPIPDLKRRLSAQVKDMAGSAKKNQILAKIKIGSSLF